MPNFSSLAGLEVAGKFVVGWGGWVEHVTTMSIPDARAQSGQNARRVLKIFHLKSNFGAQCAPSD